MDVKYQVFVSSTFVDLEKERRSVIEMVLNMGHIPVGMEAFQASDDTQWDYIKRRIDESDYYVLIVAERYGSEQNGKSYTQMEYEYAVKTGVPAVAFLLDSAARKEWPSSKVEHEKKDKVEKFRKLCQKKLVKFWRNSDDLGGKVALALSELIRDKPRTGWVRASELPNARVLNEIASLSEEKRLLQERLAAFEGDEVLRIPAPEVWRLKHLSTTTISELCDYQPIDDEPSLLDHFEYAVPILTEGCDVTDMKEQIEAISNIAYERDTAEEFLRELVTNKLLSFETKTSYPGNNFKHYTLTDYGKEFAMYLKEWKMRKDIKEVV